MQYTQQQRLAPEAPDESALYSPILTTTGLSQSAKLYRVNHGVQWSLFQFHIIKWCRPIIVRRHNAPEYTKRMLLFKTFPDSRPSDDRDEQYNNTLCLKNRTHVICLNNSNNSTCSAKNRHLIFSTLGQIDTRRIQLSAG